MNEPKENYAEWGKPDTNEYILYNMYETLGGKNLTKKVEEWLPGNKEGMEWSQRKLWVDGSIL